MAKESPRQREKEADKRHNIRKRRNAKLPEPPTGDFTWRKDQPELVGYTPAHAAAELRESAIWNAVMVPLCNDRDDRHARRSCRTVYRADEVELALFWGLNSGVKNIGGKFGLINHLRHPDQREDLELLGFAAPRVLPDRVADIRKYADGIPSGARFSNHLNAVSLKARRDAWEQIYLDARDQELALMPDEDFLTLYLDSSLADVIFTPPKINPKTGEIVNEDAITCRDGGYLPLNSHAPGARGFKAIYLWTPTGTCIGTLGVKNTIHDSPLARPLLASVENIIKPRIERLHPMVGVLCADGAFTSDEHRRQIRRMGCIENIARTNKFSENEVKRLDDLRIPFGQHPGWYTNGHAEINCHCGTAHLTCDWEPAPRAGVRATVVARCPKHGRLHVTSGEYVNRGGAWWTYNPKVVNKTQAPKKKPKTKSESEAAESDLRLGNGLTFNHWLAQEFGQKRWGHNEGIHGALANLGIIFNGSNRFRTIEEFEIANFQMLTYLHHRGIRRRLLTAVPLAA